jgi:hypothetical protein
MRSRRRRKSRTRARRAPTRLVCRLCGCRLIRWRTVGRWREIVGKRRDAVVWRTPLGTTMAAPFATRDHILPRRLRRSLANNKQWLCGRCHHRKTAIDQLQFGQPPDQWDNCFECRSLLSRGPDSCWVCHVYRGAPIVAWLVGTGKVKRGPGNLTKHSVAATHPPQSHTSVVVRDDHISAL